MLKICFQKHRMFAMISEYKTAVLYARVLNPMVPFKIKTKLLLYGLWSSKSNPNYNISWLSKKTLCDIQKEAHCSFIYSKCSPKNIVTERMLLVLQWYKASLNFGAKFKRCCCTSYLAGKENRKQHFTNSGSSIKGCFFALLKFKRPKHNLLGHRKLRSWCWKCQNDRNRDNKWMR